PHHPRPTLCPYTPLFRSLVLRHSCVQTSMLCGHKRLLLNIKGQHPPLGPCQFTQKLCILSSTHRGVNTQVSRSYVLSQKMMAPRSEEHTSELQSRFDLVC